MRKRLQWLLGLMLVAGLGPPQEAWAHAKGIYKTQAEAAERARQLGCSGTHQNKGLWMPCDDESMLHRELRQE